MAEDTWKAVFASRRRLAVESVELFGTDTAASDDAHSGCMVALMPVAADAGRLALPGGEAADHLHCTLLFLGGDASAWTPEQQDQLTESVRQCFAGAPVLSGNVFGAAHWNGDGDTPCWVWNVGGGDLDLAHCAAEEALYECGSTAAPDQHAPWAAHVCAAYTGDLSLLPAMEQRLGPVAFDRVRVSFGDSDTDIPLGEGTVTAAARPKADPANGVFRRRLTPVELASRFDFAGHQRAWEQARAAALHDWGPVAADWRNQISQQLATGTDPDEIVLNTDAGADTLYRRMLDAADAAARAQQRAAEQQGVTVPPWTLGTGDSTTAALSGLDLLRKTAQTTSRVIASSLVTSAQRQALRLLGVFSGIRLASEVDAFLQGLTDRVAQDNIGTAMTAAQAYGQQAVLDVTPGATYYATEILDDRCCITPEALVTTRRGSVPAKDVGLGDELLTHTGLWISPSQITVSEVGERIVRLGFGDGRSLRLTHDHRVLVFDGSRLVWADAGKLAVGDLVVDQSSLEVGREVAGQDFQFGDSPDGVSPVLKIGVLPSVDVWTQAVPVDTVGLDYQGVADQEVNGPGSDALLRSVGVPQGFEGFPDSPLDTGLKPAGSVAGCGAEAPAGRFGRSAAERESAVFAGTGRGRPAAGLAAVLSRHLRESAPESSSAASAEEVFTLCGSAAREAAVRVAGCVGDGNAELPDAVGAGLGHSVPGCAHPGPHLRVCELAGPGAVDGAVPGSGGERTAARPAHRRRVVIRTLTGPGGPHGAGLAERTFLDGGSAVRTEDIHNLSLQVLPVTSTDREDYDGYVYDFTVPGDRTFWAGGVLVHNCDPCRQIDGKAFSNLNDAEAAYPGGCYVDCYGGGNCRGTIDAVWGDVPADVTAAGAPEEGAVTTAEDLGAKPSKSTPRDKRLKENQMTADAPCATCPQDADHFDPRVTPVAARSETFVWDGSESRFTDPQYQKAAAACDPGDGTVKERCFLPHHDPDGTLNRDGLAAAAGRFSGLKGHSAEAVAKAKSHLVAHYHSIGEDVPSNLAAEGRTHTLAVDCPPGWKPDPDSDGCVPADWQPGDPVPDCPPGMVRDPDSDGCLPAPVKAAAGTATEPPAVEPSDGPTAPWEGVLAVEGVTTGDGREFAPDALDWRDLPLPLRWNRVDSHGGETRTEAVNVGRIDSIERVGNQLRAKGVFDLSTPDGQTVRDKVKGKFIRGVSIDADNIKDADIEAIFPDMGEMDDADPLMMMFGPPPEKIIYHGGRISGATMCDIPAFPEAFIALTDADGALLAGGALTDAEWAVLEQAADQVRAAQRSATASRIPEHPPAAWFENPGLSQITGITVTSEGRVYGHAAQWGTCHVGQAGCVAPPREDVHAYFMTGELVCDDGRTVGVGQITVGMGHAPMNANPQAAVEHYDDVSCAVVDVAVGNDAHGIWVAGAVRPDADPAKVRALRAAGRVSGDWRRIGGKLRLVGLLAVNVPGFALEVRTRARVASGAPMALVAAGMIDTSDSYTEAELDRMALRRVMDITARRIEGD